MKPRTKIFGTHIYQYAVVCSNHALGNKTGNTPGVIFYYIDLNKQTTFKIFRLKLLGPKVMYSVLKQCFFTKLSQILTLANVQFEYMCNEYFLYVSNFANTSICKWIKVNTECYICYLLIYKLCKHELKIVNINMQ